MPTFATITAESNAGVLTPSERVYIRTILGITQDPDLDDYQTSETRFGELSKRVIPDGISAALEEQNIFLCKSLRVLYKQYGKLADDMTSLKGGRDGIDYSADRNRTRIALQIDSIVFPEIKKTPLEPIPAEKLDNTDASLITSVPVKYGEDLTEYGDEYSN